LLRGGGRELPEIPAGRRFFVVPGGLAWSIFRYYMRNLILMLVSTMILKNKKFKILNNRIDIINNFRAAVKYLLFYIFFSFFVRFSCSSRIFEYVSELMSKSAVSELSLDVLSAHD
jgi:hypothetical protein